MVAAVDGVKLTDEEFIELTAQTREYAYNLMRRLRTIRQLQGVSQVELAARTGMPQSSISQWESGVVIPNLESLIRVCVGLDITLLDLVEST